VKEHDLILDEEQTPLPWPRKGDDPFALADDWWNNACVNYMPGLQWQTYAIGFKTAADLAVEQVMKRGMDQDTVVYAAVANYRQYLELAMKGLTRDAMLLLDAPGGVKATHDLLLLWSDLRPLLFEIAPDAETLDAVEVTIKRFAKMDPKSETFRYPVTKSGKPTLPPDLRHINLRVLGEAMERTGGFFEAADAEIEVRLGFKADEVAMYGDYAGP
jgi:hypothetical protein